MKNYKHCKLISVILSVILLLFASAMVLADQPISVYMNNEKMEFDVEPTIVNGRTMVPMRAIFEKLGAEVLWNSTSRTATAFKGNVYVVITIDSAYMYTKSEQIQLDAPAMIIGGRTLVPLRAVSETFECEVEWDAKTRAVSIYSKDYIDYSEETPSQTTVYVETPLELLNAIGNNKKIILTSDYYNLSDVGFWENEHVEKQLLYGDEYSDGFTVKNVVNMTIEGNAEIAIDDIMADVLRFEKCGKITLSGLTVGHTIGNDEYQCEGAVTQFTICEKININNCNLYGCGAVGIYADNVKELKVSGGKIYDCTYTGIWLTESEAVVDGTEFCDSVHFSGFIRIDSSKLVCNNARVHDIKTELHEFIETSDWGLTSEITFNNCVFYDNTFERITNGETKNLVFNNCEFSNNIGDVEHPSVIYTNN